MMTGKEVPNTQSGPAVKPSDRELFLRDWEASVVPMEHQALEADKGAVGYSLLGIKSAFILNGGALVALPAITPYFGINIVCNRGLLVFAAAVFMVGILLAVATTTLWHFTMCDQGAMYRWNREEIAQLIIILYDRQQKDSEEAVLKRTEAATKTKEFARKAERSRYWAIRCALGSPVVFLAGAGLLLYIAWR